MVATSGSVDSVSNEDVEGDSIALLLGPSVDSSVSEVVGRLSSLCVLSSSLLVVRVVGGGSVARVGTSGVGVGLAGRGGSTSTVVFKGVGRDGWEEGEEGEMDVE